jgi:hypothetical protein
MVDFFGLTTPKRPVAKANRLEINLEPVMDLQKRTPKMAVPTPNRDGCAFARPSGSIYFQEWP